MQHDIDSVMLARYFAEVCSGEEEAEMETWLREDPARRAFVEALRRVWEAAGERPRHWDVDAAWERAAERAGLARRGGDQLPPRTPREATGGRWGWPLGYGRPPMSRRARPPRAVGPRLLGYGAALAVVALAVLLAVRLSETSPSEPAAPAPKTFATQRGQRATIELIDGTQVRLNADSELALAPGFEAGSREVTLRGEAYFEVAEDPARPFRVRSGGAVVEVLGTAFNVQAYGSGAAVVVAEGEVALHPEAGAGEDAVVLGARELGRVAAGEPTTVRRSVPVERYLAWTEGLLVFEAAPFDEVEARLERWYDLEIELAAPAASVDRLTVAFGEEPLSEILHVIAATLGLRYEREGHRVVFLPASS